MIRDAIKESLGKSVKEAGYENIDIEVLPTTDSRFGDYYTNVALNIAKADSGKQPTEVAKAIVAKLAKESRDFSSEIAQNGLINFKIYPKFLQTTLRKIIEQGENFGNVEKGKGKKARVEFVSANPTGPLHIGNARGGPIGDTIANTLESNGYKVLREYLHNNIGGQIEKLGQSIINAKNGQPIEEQEYRGEYILEMAKKIEAKENAKKVAAEAVEIMLKEIIKDCKDMGIEFDEIYRESEFESKLTNKALDRLKEKGALKKKEGAVWFAPNDQYLNDREAVVVKSNGEKTYFANDIAYHNLKFSQDYDLIVDELGSGHDGHIPKLKSAIFTLGYDINKFKVIVHQNVRVKKGSEIIKMSKRAGNFVTARQVLNEVGRDAFRFYMCMFDPSTHMDFDLDKAKQKSADNPVYYVQYAHARANSILKHAKKEKISYEQLNKVDPSLLKSEAELVLVKQLVRLPELVEDIIKNFSVQLLPNYAINVADLFNKYYEKHRVIDKDVETTRARLLLVLAAKTVLQKSLNLLGVSAPEKM